MRHSGPGDEHQESRQDATGETFDLPPLPAVPATVTIAPPARALATVPTLRVPGSKYLTLRSLLVAALASGESVVRNPALSDDTAMLVRCLRALGAVMTWERPTTEESAWALRVRGTGGRLQTPPGGVLRVGNAGAVLRMLLGLGALLPEVRFETDHPDSLGRRPNAELLDALRQLGVTVEARGADGLLPITLRGGAVRGGAVTISGARSSQFVSALLFLAPLLPDGLTIHVMDGLVSASFVETTLATLATAGVAVRSTGSIDGMGLVLEVAPGQTYQPREYVVAGDVPSAAALLAAGVALRQSARLRGLSPSDPEARRLLAACERLGARLEWHDEDGEDGEAVLALAGVVAGVVAGARERGIDGGAVIDSVPVLAAAACFVAGVTRFEHVAHLRLKESDRIDDLAAEFARAGAGIAGMEDALVVEGRPRGVAGGADVRGHDDHRLVEALAVLGLRGAAPLTILGAGAVTKSYPTFFGDLALMGAQVLPSAERAPSAGEGDATEP